MLLRDLTQGSKFSDAGVGENHIDFPLRLDGFVDTVKISQLGDIPLSASDVTSDCLHGLVEFFLTTACDEYVSAFLDEKLCGSQPYPSRATGDDRQFSL